MRSPSNHKRPEDVVPAARKAAAQRAFDVLATQGVLANSYAAIDIGEIEGVCAACVRLRGAVTQKLGFVSSDAVLEDGRVASGDRSAALVDASAAGELTGEDKIEYAELEKEYQISTFGAHFVEVGVDAYTGVTRVNRMLAVCHAGRILDSKAARSQLIGAMTMGVRTALMEELAADKRLVTTHGVA